MNGSGSVVSALELVTMTVSGVGEVMFSVVTAVPVASIALTVKVLGTTAASTVTTWKSGGLILATSAL